MTGAAEFAYDGEGFLAFDIKTLTYFALKPEAIIVQHIWNTNINVNKLTEDILKRLCPDQLKLFLSYGKSSLQRKGKSELMKYCFIICWGSVWGCINDLYLHGAQ